MFNQNELIRYSRQFAVDKIGLEGQKKLKQAIVLNGSDNYKTRYLINDVCCYLEKPLVSASIFQFSGQLGVFNYKGGACYRCKMRTTIKKWPCAD